MPGKQRYIRSIDIPKVGAFNAGSDAGGASGTSSVVPPAPPTFGAPYNLVLTTATERSAATPTAFIGATWYPPPGVAPTQYIIQWSQSAAFPIDATGSQGTPIESSTITGLTAGATYYVRVLATVAGVNGAWSATVSIPTAVDTVAPSPVTAYSASFQGVGDLVIVWTNPSSANLKDVEVVIKASSGGATLATLFSATAPLVWTAAQNLAATSGAGDPSVYVELRAHSWSNVFSPPVNTSAAKALPTAPGVSVDFTGADAVYTLTPPADAARLSFVANTGVTARVIAVTGRYVYPFDQNRLDNGSPDPTLSYSFTAIDGLNQASTATSGTATNAAPAAPTVTLIGGFSQLVCSVTSAPAADFAAYEYKWAKDGGVVLTLESASAEQQYATGAGDEGAHSWTCAVRQKDLFNQFSTTTTSSAVILDTLTIGYLRAGLNYTDSDGWTMVYLVMLKDGDVSGPGITYSA